MFKGFVPKEGTPVQFLGIYALKWPWSSHVEPTMAFTEMGAEWDKVTETLNDLHESWCAAKNHVTTEVMSDLESLMAAYDDWQGAEHAAN